MDRFAFVSQFFQSNAFEANAKADETNATANAAITGESNASVNAAFANASAFDHKPGADPYTPPSLRNTRMTPPRHSIKSYTLFSIIIYFNWLQSCPWSQCGTLWETVCKTNNKRACLVTISTTDCGIYWDSATVTLASQCRIQSTRRKHLLTLQFDPSEVTLLTVYLFFFSLDYIIQMCRWENCN